MTVTYQDQAKPKLNIVISSISGVQYSLTLIRQEREIVDSGWMDYKYEMTLCVEIG